MAVITNRMVEEIIEKDLYPAGFTSSMLTLLYGFKIACGDSVRTNIKHDIIKCKKLIDERTKKPSFYLYYNR